MRYEEKLVDGKHGTCEACPDQTLVVGASGGRLQQAEQTLLWVSKPIKVYHQIKTHLPRLASEPS